ncbi:aldose 1-epimerase family protein [Levilactobacillus zymae]|uniref:aldose 1-epimerase family protein n=1 Tax=Levilactobacillus zymae TaxID=267363 RepID=UPI0028B38B93|nr:aldose 1-epimerase family protein [Levilactobacillus zymae]MDT6980658.1 aldose 1-epimerase family protein [Levilactobacillus zymae]
MLTLSNTYLTVLIDPQGAELTSVKDNASHLEYMWQANPVYWGRHAPILFPIVGRLQDNQYRVNDQTYHMTQHGFARDNAFRLWSRTTTSVTLRYASDDQSREKYPFDFALTVKYELVDHQLRVHFTVDNPSDAELPFSLGAHPGFNVPLGNVFNRFEDYQVTVAPKKVYSRVPLVGPYSDTGHPVPLDLTQPLTLDHELFAHDAQVLSLDNHETTVMLGTPRDEHGVALTVKAPYLGIWSPYPKQAPFVCLEPWWGLADDVHATGELATKVAINHLAAHQSFEAGYQVTYF